MKFDFDTSSGLKFNPVPFPYKPHCTLRSRLPVTEEEAEELLDISIPEIFHLETLTVYQMQRLPMTLLHRVELTGLK